MRLSTDQKDTLHAIYTVGGAGPVRYSSKQLAPTVSSKNAPRYFAALEAAGLIERLQGEMARTVAVILTPAGIRAAEGRRRELLPVLSVLLATAPPSEETRRRHASMLPDVMAS